MNSPIVSPIDLPPSAEIFCNGASSIPDLANRLRELAPLLLFPKYRSEGLRELLIRYVPDMTLAEVWTQRGKRVVAPSFQLSAVTPSGTKEWRARLFNNLPNIDSMPGFPDAKVIDAIMGSAAAPVHFSAHDVPNTPGGNAFVDGGVFANNPSTAALAALIASWRLTNGAASPRGSPTYSETRVRAKLTHKT